jgi:hypothetical protein
LEEQDLSFEPKIAIAALRRRLPADVIEDYDAKLKRDLASAKVKAKAKGDAKSEAKPEPKSEPKPDGAKIQPDALTKQTLN